MQELDDHTLLRQYAEQNSGAAFAVLVARHVNKVYSVALRHTRNAHAAEEITQAVFVILAKKSERIGSKVILSGWLYETSRLTAITFIRSEIRRARREQEAHMQTTLNENDAEAWLHIAPLLDDALAGLNAADRRAVVLRYFDGKSLGEVGAALGASEDAAKKRVTRAVEKLRGFFIKRGVTLTATVLTAAISANSVQAAPTGLAATVVATAAKSAVVSGSTTTLIKGALKVMAWTKMKTAAMAAVCLLVAGAGLTVATQINKNGKQAAGLKILKQMEEKYAAIGSYSYHGEGMFTTHSKTNMDIFSAKLERPCSYKTEDNTTGSTESESLYWTSGDYAMAYISWLTNTLYELKRAPEERLKHQGSLGLDVGISTRLSTGFFFSSDAKNPLKIIARTNDDISVSLLGNERVSGHDCHRLVVLPKRGMKLTLWIGADDLLIYKTEQHLEKAESTIINGMPVYYPAVRTETYDNIFTNLHFQPQDFIPENIPADLTVKETFP